MTTPTPKVMTVLDFVLQTAGLSPKMVAALRARDAVGRARYGVPLTPGNGRSALRDAQEELLDAIMYGAQRVLEAESKSREAHIAATADVREIILIAERLLQRES